MVVEGMGWEKVEVRWEKVEVRWDKVAVWWVMVRVQTAMVVMDWDNLVVAAMGWVDLVMVMGGV